MKYSYNKNINYIYNKNINIIYIYNKIKILYILIKIK